MRNGSWVQRITRDITDGLLLVDLSGMIIYINPHGKEILNDPKLTEGIRYAQFMESEVSGINDEFHQYVLDSIYDKETTHKGKIKYTSPDGKIRYFQMSSSFAISDDGKEKLGVILQFSDITNEHEIQIRYNDAVKILVAMVVIVSANNLVVALWDHLGHPFRSAIITILLEFVGVVGTLFALKYTSLTVSDFGLGKGSDIKRTLVTDGILTAAIFGLMFITKSWISTVLSPQY